MATPPVQPGPDKVDVAHRAGRPSSARRVASCGLSEAVATSYPTPLQFRGTCQPTVLVCSVHHNEHFRLEVDQELKLKPA